ncbi:MAG: hypothetical protein ACLFN4_00685, partial [Candidatus Acetothermia bacterium]
SMTCRQTLQLIDQILIGSSVINRCLHGFLRLCRRTSNDLMRMVLIVSSASWQPTSQKWGA